MKVDIGFWNEQGEYIPDIQEVSEVEMDKEFFNDIDNMVKVNKLERENAELKEKNTALEETLQTIEQLKDEDSLRIAQLVTENARLKNERTADLVKQIDELKAENERLNRCLMEELHHEGEKIRETIKYKQTSQEIREIAEFHITDADSEDIQDDMKQILDLITKAEEE